MRSITRSYRIRAYPNGAQRRLLERWFGASRWLWKTTLGIRSEAYRVCGLKLTGDDLSRWLTQWKRTAGHEWLAAVLSGDQADGRPRSDHRVKSKIAAEHDNTSFRRGFFSDAVLADAANAARRAV